MPLINLIEEQRQINQRAERGTRIAFWAFLGSAALGIIGSGSMLFLSESMDSEIARLQAKVQKLKPLRQKIDEHGAALSELYPRLTTLEDAHLMTDRWTRVLSHLSKNTPSEMWLTGLRSSGSDQSKPVQATFQGLSNRLEPVGEFILRLQGCEDLETVTLKVAQEKMIGQAKGIEFEVTASVQGTELVQPKKTDKKPEGGSA